MQATVTCHFVIFAICAVSEPGTDKQSAINP
jgi:hypothetical protein